MCQSVSRENAEHYTWGEQCDGWHLFKSHELSVIQELMPEGTAEVRHYHQRAQQFFYVLSGAATLKFAGEVQRLTAGQGCHVPAGTPHQLLNDGPGELEFLVISTPLAHGDRVLAIDDSGEGI